jgi:hypothetical protein
MRTVIKITNQILLDVCDDIEILPQLLHCISDAPNRLRGKNLLTSLLGKRTFLQFRH